MWLMRKAEVALGAQAAGQRRHCFQLPAAAPCAVIAALSGGALSGGAAGVPVAAARWRCRVNGNPQAAGMEAAPADVFDMPAIGKRMCVNMLYDVMTSSVEAVSAYQCEHESGAIIP
jgi:hypothetical protein